jgi:hypothetical protein
MLSNEIPIASPCGADWRTMKPSDSKRFCDACNKHVHDLSSMTESEARAVLASPKAEGLCVRYLHDAYGDIVFRPVPIPPSLLVRARRVAVSAAGVAALAMPMTLVACMGAPAQPAQVTSTMGTPAVVPTPSLPDANKTASPDANKTGTPANGPKTPGPSSPR